MADDIVKLALAVALQRGLARQVRNRNHPAESGFRTVLPDRDQSIWPVESASHDLDTGAVEAAEAQRRAAIPAKVALGDRGRAERGRLAAGPGEIATFRSRQTRQTARQRLSGTSGNGRC